MILITVQSYNGQSVPGLSASFDELGGTIGRADNNQLVLADPDRSISRVHAQVVFRNGGYAIIDRGSNAVLVNSQPLGNGREAPIRDGDILAIGGYVLRVSVGQQPSAADPFADLFGDGAAPASAAPRPPASTRAADPLFGPPAGATVRSPFAPSPAARSSPPAAAAALPDDWDPFAPATPALAPAAAPGGDPTIANLPGAAPSRSDSLDALFGLGGTGADPLAKSPLAAPLAQPNTATDADPLRAFGVAATPTPAPASDHVSDLNTPWVAPPLRQAATPVPAPPPLAGAVLSWNQPSREGKQVTLPGGPTAAAARSSALAASGASDQPGSLTQIIPRASAAAPAATPAPDRAAALAMPPAVRSDDALRRALADGLGIPADRLRPLDEAQMRLIGQVLREATRGTVELLVARAALKREMRTEVTMIVAKENNPLKFSPGVEVALQHLMGETLPGFMSPAAAMRDAFDDLRAHQLGVMAGMRAALEGVLLRFEPSALEAKIADRRSALASLLPSMRKAQLWEQFQQLYAQLSTEAAEDFQELFGRAFRKAYEAHIDALHGARD